MSLPPLIPRDPDADKRTRRALDILREFYNHLALNGIIAPDGNGFTGMAGLFFVGTGPPAATLGLPDTDALYLDIADPNNPLLYYKT
jgi:hypothetical protein